LFCREIERAALHRPRAAKRRRFPVGGITPYLQSAPLALILGAFLLLPILITLFFGVIETSLALLCRADVSIMTSTAADLISQAGILSTADVDNVYSASGTVLYPYYDPSVAGSAKPTIRLTSVVDDGSGAAGQSRKGASPCACIDASASCAAVRDCFCPGLAGACSAGQEYSRTRVAEHQHIAAREYSV